VLAATDRADKFGKTSASLGWYTPDPGRMRGNVLVAVRQMHALFRGRALLQW